jgi:hypothetical protein
MPVAIFRAAARAVGAIVKAVKALRRALKSLGEIRSTLRKAEHHGRGLSRAGGNLKVAGPRLSIRVDGLRQFRKELKKLADPETWTRELREVNRDAANEALREVQALARSQPRIIGQRRRPERGHWADYVNNYRVVASQTSAGVRLGTTTRRGGWYLGSNFGSINKRQFPPQNPPDHALYRGIERAMPRVVEKYDRELGRLARKAFPD